ncbi:MAG: DUF2867 domain-containing protein [bacterium]
MKVLVTGATGYIAGRLVPRLLAAGHDVRVLARDRARVQDRSWASRVETVEGDLLAPETLGPALAGVDAAYYLVHSMCGEKNFAEVDRRAARNFVEAGRGLRQVVYLGGLLPSAFHADSPDSEHLASRAETGRILAEGLRTTELRAGPIIGSGSASFEMVRYLTERLPAMIAPRWIANDVQPIAIRDVLAYLVGVLGREDALGVIDVGSDPLAFREMMYVYADVRGLKRWITPVPVLAPKLAALWVGLVTPIPNCLAVPLVQGVVRPVVGDTTRARTLFPEIEPIPYRAAVELALNRTDRADVETRWSDALGRSRTVSMEDREGLVREVRSRLVDAPPERVFASFSSLGGARGWLVWNWAWRFRGFLDQLAGGPGLRRGRRHPQQALPGDAIDFWRVEEAHAPNLLRLRAEMKVPGRAWLQWEARPEEGRTRLVQTAIFAPRGLPGALYWYGVYPVHAKIFSDLVRAIAEDAERGAPAISGERSA